MRPIKPNHGPCVCSASSTPEPILGNSPSRLCGQIRPCVTDSQSAPHRDHSFPSRNEISDAKGIFWERFAGAIIYRLHLRVAPSPRLLGSNEAERSGRLGQQMSRGSSISAAPHGTHPSIPPTSSWLAQLEPRFHSCPPRPNPQPLTCVLLEPRCWHETRNSPSLTRRSGHWLQGSRIEPEHHAYAVNEKRTGSASG